MPSVSVVVADTGPLLALARIEDLGLLPALRPRVEQLVASGYFLSDAVIEDALRQVGE